jgi:predicted PurR-regulated permease PerM
VLGAVVGTFVGLGFLVAPRLAAEMNHLVAAAPQYGERIEEQFRSVVGKYPLLEKRFSEPNALENMLPSTSSVLSRVGRYSVSALAGLVAFLVLLAVIAYMVAMPRPLIRGALQAVPEKYRDPLSEAMVKGSNTVVRWMWANAIIGAIEAVAAGIFLSVLGIPGAWIWALVTFFAELIPQLGSYLMALPPTLVALAIDPTKALWVIGFYIILQQVANNVLAPPIRSKTMNIHPVSEIFAVLALTFAFGWIGALIADPVVGFIKAVYDVFWGRKQEGDADLDTRTEAVLQRQRPYVA